MGQRTNTNEVTTQTAESKEAEAKAGIVNDPNNPIHQGAVLTDEDQTIETPVVKPKVEDEQVYEGLTTTKGYEELAAYTKRLEDKLVTNTVGLNDTTNKDTIGEVMSPASSDAETRKQLADKMFEAPEDFVGDIDKMLDKKIEDRDKKAQGVKDFWGNFYHKNADLQKQEKIVNLVLLENRALLKDMPVLEGYKLLADKTRTLLSDIKGDSSRTETMDNSTSVTLNNQTTGEKPAPVEVVEENVSFMNEFIEMRNKKFGIAT